MSDISAEWKELRPKIGNLISRMDSENCHIDAKLKELQEKEERQADLQEQIEKAYNKGLEDARNAVLQLYDNENWKEIFGSYYNFNILKDHSMAEIIEKVNQLKAEKEKQAKEQDFHIGDEIICVNECSMDYDKTFIYLGRDEYHMKMFNLDKMKAEFTNNFVDYRKTSKHYDAIPFAEEIRRNKDE